MKILKNLLVLISVIMVFSGCSKLREPQIVQHNSGMEKSDEWIKYNQKAEENNLPVLDFVATSLKAKRGVKVFNYDNFTPEDVKIRIVTKWHNCNVGDLYEYKIHMPDGRLYQYEYSRQKKEYDRFTVTRTFYVKDAPTSQIEGNWKVKIFMNGEYVLTKDFYIGNKSVKATSNNIKTKLGVFPFLDDEENSTWKHEKPLPQYLGWEILNKYKNIKVIPPKLIINNIPNTSVDYATLNSFIENDLSSDESLIVKLGKELEYDYVVLGKILSNWNGNKQKTTTDIFLIDIKSKKIIKEIKSIKSFSRGDFHIGVKDNVDGIHPMRVAVYKQVFADLEPELKTLQ